MVVSVAMPTKTTDCYSQASKFNLEFHLITGVIIKTGRCQMLLIRNTRASDVLIG
jgi:hypothetical protein